MLTLTVVAEAEEAGDGRRTGSQARTWKRQGQGLLWEECGAEESRVSPELSQAGATAVRTQQNLAAPGREALRWP